jgi:hypothetical protein
MERIVPAPNQTSGFPPTEISALLRVEGLVAFVAAVTAFQLLGGNWWLFAALILAPDLAFFGALAGCRTGARIYNIAHTYSLPAVLGTLAWLAGATWLIPVALIWIAHIGIDRAIGYGLKYPELDHATHLGWIGKAKKRGAVADPR